MRCCGRPTKAEVFASIESGLPALEKMCEFEDSPRRREEARAELRSMAEKAMRLLPAA